MRSMRGFAPNDAPKMRCPDSWTASPVAAPPRNTSVCSTRCFVPLDCAEAGAAMPSMKQFHVSTATPHPPPLIPQPSSDSPPLRRDDGNADDDHGRRDQHSKMERLAEQPNTERDRN